MVLVNILSGDGCHLPGKTFNNQQILQENPSCSGPSQSLICNADPRLRHVDPVNDGTARIHVSKRCLGDIHENSYNQNAIALANAVIASMQHANKNGFGKVDENNETVNEDESRVAESKVDVSGCHDNGCVGEMGKSLCLGGDNEARSQNAESGVKPERVICEGVHDEPKLTCDEKEEDGGGGSDPLVDDDDDDAKTDVPRIIIGDDVVNKKVVDESGDQEDDDGGGDGSCMDEESCDGQETDYNSDMSVDVDGSINDDEDDDNDDDDEISDIDVQSFLAQLDEEIAGSENYNPAIDGGYAWIVVFAVFLIQTIFLGYLKSGGIFFVEFQRQFESTASMTSLIIGLVEGIFSISAPFVLGFMVKIWSVRQLCMVGSFIFVLGVIGNAVVDRIEYLLLTHSLCFGLANGLIYGPSIYIINEYFKKKRALAMSIATTGASCGGIIFPLLARLLLDTYGFSGGIIMTAGIVMQIFIGSILLIPVRHHETNHKLCNKDVETNGVGSKAAKSKDKSGMSILETLKLRWGSGRNGAMDSKSKSKNSIVNKSNSSIFQKHQNHALHSTQHKFLGTGIKSLQLDQFSSKLEICEEGVPLEIQSEYHNNEKTEPAKDSVSEKKQSSVSGRFTHFLSDNTSLSSQHSHLSGSICSSAHHGSSRNRLDVIHYGNNPNELGIFPSHASSLLLMSKVSSSKQTLSRSMLFQSTSTLNNTIADIISIDQDFKRLTRVQSPEHESRNISAFRRMIPRFCDSPLLKSASFWVLVPFYFTAAIGVGLSQIFVLPLAKERGLTDDQAAFCLSLLNMLDVIAHLVPGIILNFGFMTSTTVAILPMAVVGITGHLTPFCHSYESIIGVSIAFGLSMGFFYALQSLIVIDTLGIENYTSAIGIYYLVCGMAGAISYPVAGALKDCTGSYTATFQYLATMQLLSVVILIILPLVKRLDVRRGVLKS